MSIVETVLVFVGIPAGAFALFALVILGPGAVRAPRYRPGQPWDFEPVWYLPHPSYTAGDSHGVARALNSAGPAAITGRTSEPVKATGGASGEW
jgi:hypothetical protein